MSFDLLPKRFLTFPTLPSSWDEDDNWLSVPSAHSNLSISEDEKYVYVGAGVPGINPDDVEITYQDGYVWIHGEVKEEEKDKKRKYYRQSAQSFSYRVAVPGDIDETKEPVATYKNGVMTVAFEKSPVRQPKKIVIKKAE